MTFIYDPTTGRIGVEFVWVSQSRGRSQHDYPYAFDTFYLWKDESHDQATDSSVDSDRMFMEAHSNFIRARRKVDEDKPQSQHFSDFTPDKTSEFLTLFYRREIKATALAKGCNQSTGHPIYTFFYREKELVN